MGLLSVLRNSNQEAWLQVHLEMLTVLLQFPCANPLQALKSKQKLNDLGQIQEVDNFCLLSLPFLSLIHFKSKVIIKLYFILDSCRT